MMDAQTRHKGAELARLAAMLCLKSDFQKFAGVSSSATAAAWIRQTCGVESRAELDHMPEAARKFHDLIRKPYLHSKEPSHG